MYVNSEWGVAVDHWYSSHLLIMKTQSYVKVSLVRVSVMREQIGRG